MDQNMALFKFELYFGLLVCVGTSICYSCGWQSWLHENYSLDYRAWADTREEWFIALQACFRRNVTVVAKYASLGEEAICHSLNETQVTTVICGNRELKKLLDISGQIDTVERVICMDDEMLSNPLLTEGRSGWKIFSYSEVEGLGRENPVDADPPLPTDVAVIMYTSGSTGLPKFK